MRNSCGLWVRGEELLRCCCNAVLQFKNIRLENQWKKLRINPLTTCASRLTIEIGLEPTSYDLRLTVFSRNKD